MEQAINRVQELLKEDSVERNMERLKPDINNLLHMYLPDTITIKEVEILAVVINEMIWHPEEFLNPKI